MHELHTSAFSALIPEPCDQCVMPKPIFCEEPFAISIRGKRTYPGGEDVAVEWPACPRRWHVGRRWAGAIVPLNMLCNYALERDVHKAPLLGAGGHRLLLEALHIRELPSKLLEIKRYDEMKEKQGK